MRADNFPAPANEQETRAADGERERFLIGAAEKRRRWRNAGWGLVFSAGLVAAAGYEHQHDAERAARGVVWTLGLLLALANLGNLVFLLRYLRRIRSHYLELQPGRLRFVTDGEASELDLEQVVAMRQFTRFGKLQHIQLLLRNNRGIRLEGYADLALLAQRLQSELSPEKLLR